MEIKQAIHSSGNLHVLKPRKALNKAFLKIMPNSLQIQWRKANFDPLNTNPDTSFLEAEIDQLVYRHYGLPQAEIQMIEN